MSNRDHLTIDQLTGSRGMRTRREKLGLAISVMAFFGAIGIVGWFVLGGNYAEGGLDTSGPSVLFEGGEYRTNASADSDSDSAGIADVDDYVVGSYGDPVDELYADDSDGGWGAMALERSAPDIDAERSGPRRLGRISRGSGGSN
ncbi:hypothetical protein [Aurantiacibacter gilvus]|uniref:Uncharacterized protein n=1 Tax=Aurantiacibacter gilvus TaxID=3139141 RepID=A0ABU9IB15_9SPHN